MVLSKLHNLGWKRFLPLALIITCFAAGSLLLASAITSPKMLTMSLAKHVTKHIEDIKIGDWVLAKDPNDAGPAKPHQVVGLPRNWTEHVVHIQVAGGVLQATRNHPFYVEGKGWIEARDLKVQDRLRDEHDRGFTIEKLWTEDRQTGTFNLTIEGVHTYYVMAGGTPVLVHNVNPWEFGDYDNMIRNSSPFDGLDIHHYPQGQPASEVIPGYEYSKGLAVGVPAGEHRGLSGTNYQAGEFTGSPKDLIDEAKANMRNTSIPEDKLSALDKEARSRYLPCD